MNVGIYQSLIICIFVLIYGVHTISVVIEGNKAGLLGENGTEIECLFPQVDISSVSFMAFNKSSITSDLIATYRPGRIPQLNPQGQYLKGRVTLTPISLQSTKAVLTFNQLMCIDDKSYQCNVNYFDSDDVRQDIISNNILSISVQVPPSTPDSILLVITHVDTSATTTKDMDYSTSLPSTGVKLNDNNTVSASTMEYQNTTTAFNHSTIQTSDNDITTPTPSPTDISFNSSYRTTTYSIQQTTTAQNIAEGDNITVVCMGDVGNPPAEYFFQKYRSDHTLFMNYTATASNISEIAENCSSYRISSFTFQVTAKDNNASIRCVVNSSMPEFDELYKETAPIEVNYEVRMPNITKYPNKDYYVVGLDTRIDLTCKSKGNPQPDYFWYKDNSVNVKSASENLTIMVMNKTDSGVYTCRVNNTFSGDTYRSSADVKVDVRNEADTSTLPSSSTGSSSGTDEKIGNPGKDLTPVYIGVSAGVVVVLLVLLGCYLFKRNRKGKDESTENNGSTNNLMHYSSKHGRESRPGGYDSVVLEGDAPVISSGKKGQNVEDVRKHNEEYMKNQTNEEKNESKSPTSDQPVIYAEVNKANKSNKLKDKPDASNQQDDDTYAGTQEGIYDQSGNSRHKVDKNAEQFDKIGDVKKQNSTDDAESSLKSSQKGSYINHALNKGEKQVATVPPISRSSVGSQGDEQTTESIAKLSQKEYENVKGTDTSDGHTINQTSL